MGTTITGAAAVGGSHAGASSKAGANQR